jgi:hypothetical protein
VLPHYCIHLVEGVTSVEVNTKKKNYSCVSTYTTVGRCLVLVPPSRECVVVKCTTTFVLRQESDVISGPGFLVVLSLEKASTFSTLNGVKREETPPVNYPPRVYFSREDHHTIPILQVCSRLDSR